MTHAATPGLSVVMPCYNRARHLERVLRAYDAQVGEASFEIVAVDDGSSDGTGALLQTYRPRRFTLRPILLDSNAGPANARNHGIAAAAAPLVLLVGDDIRPAPDFVASHVAAHVERPGMEWTVLGRTVWPEDLPRNTLMAHIDGVGAQQFSYHHMRPGQVMDFRHFYTSNVSLKRALFERVTPWFDTSFPHAALEDAELGYRLERVAGMRIAYSDAPLGFHYHYYNVWGFAQRQYLSGRMAALLARKHPALGRIWRFGRVRDCDALARSRAVSKLVGGESGGRVDMIERLALHLCSHYELNAVRPLDRLYLLVLESFLLKGMIDGELSAQRARPAYRALLVCGLLPHLLSMLEELEDETPPPPQEVTLSLRALGKRLPPVRVEVWRRPLLARVRDLVIPAY